jgi:BirA family biotin operon repressor/biotin-[acetyl-CoA-carboxylase] ligase
MAVPLPNRLDARALLRLLAEGGTRSAAHLASEFHTSCGEITKLVRKLRGEGVDIDAVGGRSYRLAAPVELLDPAKIRSALSGEVRSRLHRLDVFFDVDSTNTHLLQLTPPPLRSADVCSSELQHAGRGRRGRRWICPFGAGLALSLGWSFAGAATVDPTLSLAVGVAVSRSLERLGAKHVRLKWPNDIWLDDRKIGGILVEVRMEAGGPAHVVIGVGLNVSLSAGERRAIEATGVRVAAISDACPEPVSRNVLAAALLEQLLGMLDEFERSGFDAFRQEWAMLDALAGRQARVFAGNGSVAGTARGVDRDGALLLEVGGQLQRHVSGEVSLRLNEGDG